MDLEQFVETTLKQVINGVKKAQENTRLPGKNHREGDLVNPPVMYAADSAPRGKYFSTMRNDLVHFIDFDVAVTTDLRSEVKGGLSLRIAGVGFGGEGGTVDKDSVVSRIKFQVPLVLPRTEGG